MGGMTRVGRSRLKKLLLPLLPSHQILELEPGFSMELDLSKTNHEFLFWFYEEHESSLQWAIQNLLPKGGTFVDCGANLGLMGLLAIHRQQARTLFIEPHPRLVQTILKNIEINGFASEKVRVMEAAASNQDGTASLQIDSISDGGHSLGSAGRNDSLEVKTVRLETLFGQFSIDHVDFLKIDAEGHDFQVLEGLGAFLEPQKIGMVYIEMGGDFQVSWKLLTDRGYRAFAAETIYIDRLRKLQGMRDCSQYFLPAEPSDDGNLFWCAPGSGCERFLLNVAGF